MVVYYYHYPHIVTIHTPAQSHKVMLQSANTLSNQKNYVIVYQWVIVVVIYNPKTNNLNEEYDRLRRV